MWGRGIEISNYMSRYGYESSSGLTAVDMICYKSFEQAEPVRDQWDAFIERAGADLYLSFDWCEIWWKHFGKGRQLEIYIASTEGEIVAVVPMFREHIRWGPFSLRVVRLVGCDHLTTACSFAVDADKVASVAGALILQLNRNGSWDVIHMGEMAGYCGNAGAFAHALRGCDDVGKVIFGDNDYPNMVFDIPGSFDEFLKTLSLKERRNVKHDQRKLTEGADVPYLQPKTREDFEKAFNNLIGLHTEHWNNRGWLGHFGEWPGVEAFHREIGAKLLESGRLVLVEVHQNNKLMASEYGGRLGSRVHWIIGARAEGASCRVGYCAVLQYAIAAGAKQIDAGNGIYDYKRRLGAKILGVKNITVINHRFFSKIRFRTMRCFMWFVSQVYFRLWFWHLAPWIRQKWPNLRAGWLKKGMWKRFIRSRFLLTTKKRCPVSTD